MMSRIRRHCDRELGVHEPESFWTPPIGHWFPGMTPARMVELDISQFIGMLAFMESARG